jgi:hypothetical protein
MEAEFDITISGGGFYTIRAHTERATYWTDEFIEGSQAGLSYCDDTRMITEIAEEAMEEGFNVGINGRLYLGDNHCAA